MDRVSILQERKLKLVPIAQGNCKTKYERVSATETLPLKHKRVFNLKKFVEEMRMQSLSTLLRSYTTQNLSFRTVGLHL